VAEASRGVFRRLYRYIWFCLGGTRGLVGVEDVRRVLAVDVVMEDLGLELASFLRGDDPRRAVELLELLRVRGGPEPEEDSRGASYSNASLSRS
jgi:hypothetical protein